MIKCCYAEKMFLVAFVVDADVLKKVFLTRDMQSVVLSGPSSLRVVKSVLSKNEHKKHTLKGGHHCLTLNRWYCINHLPLLKLFFALKSAISNAVISPDKYNRERGCKERQLNYAWEIVKSD